MNFDTRDAAALAKVITKALQQDKSTPVEHRLSHRVLLEMSLQLLEHLADQNKETGRSPGATDGMVPLT
jgi:hypothetical protein